MPHVLLTGGSGFFGGILKRHLLRLHFQVTSVDRVADTSWHPRLEKITGDLRDPWLLNSIFRRARYDAVFHCAAVLSPTPQSDEDDLWTSNVHATRRIAEACRRSGVPRLIFLSTSLLWKSRRGSDIREEEPPAPPDLYGASKWAAEQDLYRWARRLNIVILRCPAIVDRRRPGSVTMLFELIREGRSVWLLGDGANRCQLISVEDLVRACMAALNSPGSDVLHVASDHALPLQQMVRTVIEAAGSLSRVRSLPGGIGCAAMRLAEQMGPLPLGPYQRRIMTEERVLDTTRVRQRLGWRPTLTQEQILAQTYRHFLSRRQADQPANISVFSGKPPMFRLLRWVS